MAVIVPPVDQHRIRTPVINERNEPTTPYSAKVMRPRRSAVVRHERVVVSFQERNIPTNILTETGIKCASFCRTAPTVEDPEVHILALRQQPEKWCAILHRV